MILVTGGAGYIGSHTCVELINSGREIIVVDNFSNSKAKTIENIKKITKTDFKFIKADVTNKGEMEKVFKENKIDCIIHFAAYKAVGESVLKPLKYYQNNLIGILNIIQLMQKYGCNNIVFSSSATVYGVPKSVPIKEDAPLLAINPYGSTKIISERILSDACKANQNLSVVLLRYFNPIGSHDSGLLGDDPKGIPNNLMPYICKVSNGELEMLHIFGNDYDTPDKTAIRDYIHVVDLAKGHVKAIDYLVKHKGCEAINLGTGVGYSVLDIVNSFQKANNIKIPYVFDDRRPGDVTAYCADPTKAKKLLGWVSEKSLDDMCKSAWNFIKNNK